MKKIALLSAVLVLIGSTHGFATSNTSSTTTQTHGQWQGFPSQTACQIAVKGATCVQHGTNWFPSHQQTGTTITPATTTPTAGATAPTAVGSTAPKAPAAPTPPTPPAPTAAAPAAPAAAPAASSGSSFWPFGGSKSTSTTTNTNNQEEPAAAEAKRPVDPHAAAKGKVYGSQGDCQGQTAGHCVATDCSTHLGGVCEGTKGTVWSYSPK